MEMNSRDHHQLEEEERSSTSTQNNLGLQLLQAEDPKLSQRQISVFQDSEVKQSTYRNESMQNEETVQDMLDVNFFNNQEPAENQMDFKNPYPLEQA